MNNWTSLYIKLNGEMKKIGNICPSTGAMSLYFEYYNYYDSPDLYYVDSQGLYKQFN